MFSRTLEVARAAKLALESVNVTRAGLRFASQLPEETNAPEACAPLPTDNPLEDYFDGVTVGLGIWKWRHYFPIYHRYLEKFVGKPVHVAEIGIYSGGSLRMWRSYFGAESYIYGIDVEPACRVHRDDHIEIFIGDQGDPSFWQHFRRAVPRLDVVIDDGGHLPRQQITSLVNLLPHVAMGGVYICEDIAGAFHQFHSFVDGLTRPLSAIGGFSGSPAKPVHQHVAAVHRHPGITVIEKPDRAPDAFPSERRGTVWQPGIYPELG